MFAIHHIYVVKCNKISLQLFRAYYRPTHVFTEGMEPSTLETHLRQTFNMP